MFPSSLDPDRYTDFDTNDLNLLGHRARYAAHQAMITPVKIRNDALARIIQRLDGHRDTLLQANAEDLQRAKQNNLSSALLDRLQLTPKGIDAMIASIREIMRLPDPIGEINHMRYVESGIQVGYMRAPIGVIGVIYESRPNVTIDVAALCLKSGNACILRGGSEAFHTNRILLLLIQYALASARMDLATVQAPQSTDHDWVRQLIGRTDLLDLVIPRGGKGLIKEIVEHAKVSVLKHLDGVCHVFIDREADLRKAKEITINAKTRRYGVCNALETLLVDERIASVFLSETMPELIAKGVVLRGCPRATSYVLHMEEAQEEDWRREYLAPILAVRVVDNAATAIEHINRYGSHHTDAIVTENYSTGRHFLRAVDSSSVLWNASTAFADGFEYGLGAEVGISTDKLHARGPVGLIGLTSQKFIVFGDGEIRQS